MIDHVKQYEFLGTVCDDRDIIILVHLICQWIETFVKYALVFECENVICKRSHNDIHDHIRSHIPAGPPLEDSVVRTSHFITYGRPRI